MKSFRLIYKYTHKKLKRDLESYKTKLQLLKDFFREVRIEYQKKNKELQKSNNELVNLNKTINDQYKSLYQKEEELLVANKILKSKEEKLYLLNEELQKAYRLKSEFLANISHELRTPLNSIIGFSELLQDSTFGALSEKQLKFTNNIQNSGKHLLDLINDILDLSKVEAGKIQLNIETINVAEQVDYVISTFLPLAEKKSITLEVNITNKVSTMDADEIKFRQILINIVSNAIKFTTDYGTVKIQVENYISETNEEFLKFIVTDTGIGIKKEDFSKIFHEFEQIDASYSKKSEGTGLGLALTKKLVESHRGEIWFTSEIDKGTVFTWLLPRNVIQKRNNDIWDDFTRFEPSVNFDDKLNAELDSIIIFSSSDKLKKELTLMLSEQGFKIFFTDTLEDLRKKTSAEHPALLLIDMTEDVPQYASTISGDAVLSLVPTLLIISSSNKQLSKDYGSSNVIFTPVKREELCVKVDKFRKKRITAKKEVIIIDDDINVIEMVQRFFDYEENIQIKGYTNPQEAYSHLSESPDLVIMDLMMPGLNGFDFLTRVDHDFPDKKMKFLIFTIKDINMEEKRFLKKRTIKVIDKTNYSRDLLIREVRNILS